VTSLRRPNVHLPRVTLVAWDAIFAAVARLVRIRRNRRATLDLLDLDADRLADIGLSRADVHVSLFDPRTPDPTGMLEALAAERRRAGRRWG
jgi:uncharacterized protein YjiS (DUF1127 family)